MGIVQFVQSTSGKWDPKLYAQLLGAANAFKEGDVTVGVAAATEGRSVRCAYRAGLVASRR